MSSVGEAAQEIGVQIPLRTLLWLFGAAICEVMASKAKETPSDEPSEFSGSAGTS